MNVLIVSQCDKRALVESRRILDQFAERRGERTWQTSITRDGLETLRKLLRKTARKNTAVACHWIRGLDHSELVWVVGDAKQFNQEGAVPTNWTERDVLRGADENDWHTLAMIRALAQLAGLLHDLGKASVAFQERLRGERSERNRYRHEWVSLRMFQAFVGAATSDDEWLNRLGDAERVAPDEWVGLGRYQRDGIDAAARQPFRSMPPLAAAIGWLVVTHHRLPVVPVIDDETGKQSYLGKHAPGAVAAWLTDPTACFEAACNEIVEPASHAELLPYWTPAAALPVVGERWRKDAARVARKIHSLASKHENRVPLDNPYVMHLARLSLMLADHHYSSLPADAPQRAVGDRRGELFANTDSRGKPKQELDEHLIGVAQGAGLIAHALPGFARHLPRLANHRALKKRTPDARFAWQNRAADAASSLRTAAAAGGFVINMASTGCGKTLANARILYALSDPAQGLRATYALGLRTLTLQTGRSYRRDLHLSDEELAVRVGGSASRELFEYYERLAEARGSASAQELLEEDSHVLYEGRTSDHPLLSRALADPQINRLISAPMLVCTVDHMVPATEAQRAGRQIAPMLRLMSADLVLDELDDYDMNDLPALTRLVHWAGLLGTRVVLASATLPPALVEGMFAAYQAGLTLHRRNRGAPQDGAVEDARVACLWVDEFGTLAEPEVSKDGFAALHARFVDKRCEGLAHAPTVRRAELVKLPPVKEFAAERLHDRFAEELLQQCLRLHAAHAETDPKSKRRVSFGLVRMANVDPLFEVARALIARGAPNGMRLHLCVYHARFPLLQRSAIEQQLDAVFDRRGDSDKVFELPAVRRALDEHPEQDQLFVVLASPVCEVGRDWDVDWAVVEPSSMRSLIQLAGRVQRHRRRESTAPNLALLDTNVKGLRSASGAKGKCPPPLFTRPGFERDGERLGALPCGPFRLASNRLGKLVEPDEYERISALPRIRARAPEAWRLGHSWVDLEHARMNASMLPRARWPQVLGAARAGDLESDEAAAVLRSARTMLSAVLPQQQPFRKSAPEVAVVFLPDSEEDPERLELHRIESEGRGVRAESLYVPIDKSLRRPVQLAFGQGISRWGEHDLLQLLQQHAERLDLSLRACAERLAGASLRASERGWLHHPWLGFGPPPA